MKKYLHIFAFIAFIFSSPIGGGGGCLAQTISTDKNAVVHSKLRVETTNEADANDPTKAIITINYSDGLGRNLQSVGYKQSPSQKDLISGATNYDKYGRPTFLALPSPATTGTGTYKNNPITLGQSFYGDNRPYSSVSRYENSILGREREVLGVGQAWETNNKKGQIFDETAGSDIRLYKLDANNNIIKNDFFPVNSLFKKRVINEQGYTSIEITDKQGRIIQKQQQDDTGYITTYYIYDGLNRIKAVIQPEGYELNQSINYNSTEWNRWVFFYLYDHRGRLIEKKVPSADLEYMVYDKWDRLVWQQTAQQKEFGKWAFKKYDNFNRLILSGEKSESRDRANLQTEANAWTGDRFESRVSGGVYYSFSNSYPQIFTSADIREVYFYDNYTDWLPSNMTFDGANAYHAQHPFFKGFATGGQTRNTDNGNWLIFANYYDNKRRIIQSFAHNLYGKAERTDLKYNFVGEILETKSLLFDQNNVATVQVERFEYDHTGRRTIYKVAQNAAPDEIVCNYEYNEIGQLSTKKYFPNQTFTIGGAREYIIRPSIDGIVTQNNTQDIARKYIILQPSIDIKAITLNTYRAEIDPNAQQGQTIQGLQTMNFKHHIRGGLLGINLDNANNPTPKTNEGDLFAMKLSYENEGFYDGNIGKQSWQNINPSNNTHLGIRSFAYTYTPNNALKSAIYSGIGAENFSMPNLSYDKNGNITNLQRNGKNGENFGNIDYLGYNYNGNRLLGVTDAVNGNEDVGDFRDNGSNNDYTYWNDGSLKSDANKGISLIEYDTYLQKVKQVNFSNGNWVKFFYGIGGMLIKRTNSLGDIWEYTPKAIYKNGVLYQISQSEGRVLSVANVWIYEFEYRDHQNNLRVAFKADGNQLVQTQTQEQDPFGLEIKPLSIATGNAQNFRFQNQEKVQDFGLNLNWFKYRPQDPTYGRMWQVDMLADKYVHNSTYAFSENKVTNHIELDGLEAVKSVPDWIRKPYTSVANSIFKSTFSEALPKKLIDHFSYGGGKTYQLTKQEMIEVNAVKTGLQGVTENDTKKFASILSNIADGKSGSIDFTVAGGALSSGTLGRFGINFQGEITKSNTGNSWTFSGTMQYTDAWDFKTTPTQKGDIERSQAGDIMTQVGDMYLPGTGFNIISPKVPVTQTSEQSSVSFFENLSPKPIVNKVANEVGKTTNN